MNKDEAFDVILSTKVIAVIRMADTEKLAKVIGAVQEGGVKAI